MTDRQHPWLQAGAAGAALAVLLAMPAWAAPRTPRLLGPTTTASQLRFALSANTLAVTGFQYTGVVPVGTLAGPVTALRFVASTAAFTGLSVDLPCHPVGQGLALRVRYTTPPSAVSSSTSITELFLTQLDYRTTDLTVPPPVGGLYHWTVALPPPASLLAGGAGTLTDVAASAVIMAAPALTTPGLSEYSSFC